VSGAIPAYQQPGSGGCLLQEIAAFHLSPPKGDNERADVRWLFSQNSGPARFFCELTPVLSYPESPGRVYQEHLRRMLGMFEG
jgi:hypothetical protein